METLHVDELASEGERIRQRMHSPSKELLQDNPDFSATLDTIDVLVSRVENVRSRLDMLWHSRNEKLEANLKQRKFEAEADQVIERCYCLKISLSLFRFWSGLSNMLRSFSRRTLKLVSLWRLPKL